MKITDHKLPEGIALTFRVPEGNIKPVSYTHLRAHET